eukprot:scaffold5039_cov119-Cylindrotheca_fusiformis.AAC.3
MLVVGLARPKECQRTISCKDKYRSIDDANPDLTILVGDLARGRWLPVTIGGELYSQLGANIIANRSD